MARILIADDEEKIRALVIKYAQFEGHETREARDGLEAVAAAEREPFDLMILDVMMPGLDGFSACREIRKHCDTPILMLSARGEEYDRIHGFEAGVDDYVVKPFSPRELMLRVGAILKRNAKGDRAEVFTLGALTVNFSARTVELSGARVPLSPREYELLFYLIRNRNIALSRERLLSEVWGYDFFGDDRTLDTHIKLLRRSLGEYSRHIVTVRGVGYRFEAE